MRKLLMILTVLLLASCTAQKKQPAAETADLGAVIISDLHYSESDSVNTIVPLASHMKSTMETLVSSVISRHPDVFIMTGDNTNNGREDEIRALIPHLQKIHDAGIRLIITTGNHDMRGSTETYEKLYFPLLETDARDGETLSYVSIVNGVMFLAMDDSSFLNGNGGEFPSSTMQWLKEQLEKARAEGIPVIFLSHYSLLTGRGSGRLDSYRIRNGSLLPLLHEYGVKLCFTGHQHSQILLRDQDLTEVISSSLPAFPCMSGFLEIKDGTASYSLHPLDFDTFAPEGFTDTVHALEEEYAERQTALYEEVLAEKIRDPAERKAALDLLLTFFDAYGRGRAASAAGKILSDADYPLLKDALAGTNYGPWIEETLHGMRYDADSFTIPLD